MLSSKAKFFSNIANLCLIIVEEAYSTFCKKKHILKIEKKIFFSIAGLLVDSEASDMPKMYFFILKYAFNIISLHFSFGYIMSIIMLIIGVIYLVTWIFVVKLLDFYCLQNFFQRKSGSSMDLPLNARD